MNKTGQGHNKTHERKTLRSYNKNAGTNEGMAPNPDKNRTTTTGKAKNGKPGTHETAENTKNQQ